MIKRRYYKSEHGDGNEASSASSSSSSSSSSDSEVEAEPAMEPGTPPSGYESEDSSVAEEFNADSSYEDDSAEKVVREEPWISSANLHISESLEKELKGDANHESIEADLPSHVLKLKSVYRCRICPKVICLNEETMRAHVNSKKHARSKKLLKENNLREMLNDHGEIENQETAAELHARVVALAEEKPKGKKKRQIVGSMDKEKPKMKKERLSAGSSMDKMEIILPSQKSQRGKRKGQVQVQWARKSQKKKKERMSAGSMDKEKPKGKKERVSAGSMGEEVGDDSNKKRNTDGLNSSPIKRKRKNGS